MAYDEAMRRRARAAGARPIRTVGDVGEGVTWWVDYGEEWSLPFRFLYDGDDPFQWTVTIEMIGGEPTCVALCAEDQSGIAPLDVRSFSLARKIEEAVLLTGRPIDEDPRQMMRWPTPEEARKQKRRALNRLRRQQRARRQHVDDKMLQRVADIYRAHPKFPSKAVADELGYPHEYARKLVMRARDREFLEPTTERRKG